MTVNGSAAPQRVDLRLIPAALGAWAATLLGINAPPVVTLWCAGASATAGLVVLRHAKGQALALTIAAALLVTAAFGVATAFRAQAVANHPAALAAVEQRTAELAAVITTDPRLLAAHSGGGPRRVLVAARITELRVESTGRAGPVALAASGNIVVLAPAQSWGGLVPSQQVRFTGTLRPPRGNDLTVAAVFTNSAPEKLGNATSIQRAASTIRGRFSAAAAGALPADEAGLLPGLVVGDETNLPQHVKDNFTTAGLSHLTAVSGANVTLVCGAVLLLLRMLGAGPRVSALGAALALAGFVVLARPSASVLRAAAMGAVALLALVTERRKQAMPALGAAVLALLAVYPSLAVNYGFALSVVATTGLVLLGPVIADWLRSHRCPRGVAESVAIAAAAQLVTAPVVAMMSGQFSFVAVVANVLVAPVVAAATVLGVLGAVLCLIWAPAAHVVIWLAGVPVRWMLLVAEHLAGVPGATTTVPDGVRGGALLAAVTVVVLVLAKLPPTRPYLAAVVLGLALVWVPTRWITPGWPAAGWVIAVCDVGQGDAVLLSSADGRVVVVDVGPEPAAMDRCLTRLKVDTIAMIMLSHLHADHIEGLEGALRGREVGQVLVGPGRDPAGGWEAVVRRARDAGVRVAQTVAGDTFAVGDLVFTVLAPSAKDSDLLGENDQSIVTAVDTAVGRVLLTGDVEVDGQRALLDSGQQLRSDILKVPHHGAGTTLPEFLQSVRPQLALVTVGADNDYGHPHPQTLGALHNVGAVVLRTDQHGDFAVRAGSHAPQVVISGATVSPS